MKRVFLMVLIIFTGFASQAQNVVYDANAEVRVVPAFSGIEVSGAVSLYLSQGTTQGVAVSAGEEKYNNKIQTEVKNGILKISVDGGVWNGFNWTNRKLKAYVTVTTLNRLDVSGASYVSVSGSIKSKELKLEVSGASEVKGTIMVDNLNMDVSGASVARLSGNVKDGLIDASGAAKINSYGLVIDNCNASSSGASDIKITINNELNADASGGSSINYKGPGVGRRLNTSAGATIKNKSNSEN